MKKISQSLKYKRLTEPRRERVQSLHSGGARGDLQHLRGENVQRSIPGSKTGESNP